METTKTYSAIWYVSGKEYRKNPGWHEARALDEALLNWAADLEYGTDNRYVVSFDWRKDEEFYGDSKEASNITLHSWVIVREVLMDVGVVVGRDLEE